MQKLTEYNQKNNINSGKWFIVDAKGVRLGILASEVAKLLIDKNNPNRVDYQPSEVGVIVVNTDLVDFHPSKGASKKYYRHSGYIGNLKERTLDEQMKLDSRKVIESAVKGMLPKTKLQDRYMKKLRLFQNDSHGHVAQEPEKVEINFNKSK